MLIDLESVKKVEQMTPEEKNAYYEKIRRETTELPLKSRSRDIVKKLISNISPMLRNYDLDIIGEENVPKDDSAVFVCNHSNSHDFFTLHETFGELGRNVSPFGASDDLTITSLTLFKAGDVTLIDRDSKESSLDGMIKLSKKVIDGVDGVIYGEGTWNLHPTKVMQPIKAGASQVAVISNKVVIPMISEYVEVPDLVEREKDLYTKCIVQFGKPIIIKPEDNIFAKTMEIQKVMEQMRLDLWSKLSIKKNSLDDIDKEIYLNHTYQKKFGAFGFEYDSEQEAKYLMKDANGNVENEYTMDENGNFVPGVTHKR